MKETAQMQPTILLYKYFLFIQKFLFIKKKKSRFRLGKMFGLLCFTIVIDKAGSITRYSDKYSG